MHNVIYSWPVLKVIASGIPLLYIAEFSTRTAIHCLHQHVLYLLKHSKVIAWACNELMLASRGDQLLTEISCADPACKYTDQGQRSEVLLRAAMASNRAGV